MSINKTNLNNNLLNRYTDKIKNCNFVIWFFKNSICLGNNYQLNTLDKLFWLWLAIIQNTRYLVSYWNNFPLTYTKCKPFFLLTYFIYIQFGGFFSHSPTKNVHHFLYWFISYSIWFFSNNDIKYIPFLLIHARTTCVWIIQMYI